MLKRSRSFVQKEENSSLKKKKLEREIANSESSSDGKSTVICKVTKTNSLEICSTSKVVSFKKSKLGLNVNYYPNFLELSQAKAAFNELERELQVYLNASQNEVKVFGKVYKVPRKQAAFGDPGLVYEFSGVRVPANPWIPILGHFRDLLSSFLGETFNFVLVNRYKDGQDHVGEHRDNEVDLVPKAPIAALSFGQRRDFIFKHKDARGSKGTRKDIDSVKVCLEHGSLLVMNHPTNMYWYHSLPVRKLAIRARISLI